MIHNIEDKKKKPGQYHDGEFSKIMTEEELMELIGQVEAHEMLHAPAHMKENIFGQIRTKRHAARKRQVFIYRAKVLVAMAAALAVLILMPGQNTTGEQETFAYSQTEDESLEKMALRRQKSREDNWERYMEMQKQGGVRGFFEDINRTINQLGAKVLK